MSKQRNGLLERYLRTATRGLRGIHKAQVREELESHVWEKVERLRVLGVPEGEAVRRVLLELGAPEAISRGMFRASAGRLVADAGVGGERSDLAGVADGSAGGRDALGPKAILHRPHPDSTAARLYLRRPTELA